jgi:hypothetical protein
VEDRAALNQFAKLTGKDGVDDHTILAILFILSVIKE